MNLIIRGLALGLVIIVLAAALAGCGTTTAGQAVDAGKARIARLCALESLAHRIYVIAAPLVGRPAAAQAREQAFYEKVMARCESAQTGATAQAADEIARLIDQARAERAKR